jgi:PadR family transcriptional regulator PadR
MSEDAFENLRLELRRGCLVVAVLAALRAEQYGYTLRKTLASQWREEERRNKRFYRITEEGGRVLQRLLAEWKSIDTSLQTILREEDHGTR